MSQKRYTFPLFSGLTRFLAFAVHLAALAGPEVDLAVWVFLRVGKTRYSGSQSLTHISSVRTIEMTLESSASSQVDLHRKHHQVVVGDEEEAAVEMAVRQRQHHPYCSASGSQPGCSLRAAGKGSPRRAPLVVGPLVQFIYAEAWTTRAGAAISSGYGKQALKKKLLHIGGGGKPDGFGPFVLSPAWCHAGFLRKDLPSSKASGLIFSMIIPLSKSLRVKRCLTRFALKSRFAAV